MKKIFILLFCLMALTVQAQTVTKTRHIKGVKTDVVSTGTLTIRKPDYICISTDADRDQLIMDGTKFTMVMGGKKHKTDSRRNRQFATFQAVLSAVINEKPIPASEELTIKTEGGKKEMTITPSGKKKRQMFSSFLLVVDAKTGAFKQLRMTDRKGGYTEYVFK